VSSYTKIGDTLAVDKSALAAIRQYESALNLTRILAEKDPQNTEWTSAAGELKRKIDDLTAKPTTQGSAP
jgi:autotransporter translocation and assembly factor TamB